MQHATGAKVWVPLSTASTKNANLDENAFPWVRGQVIDNSMQNDKHGSANLMRVEIAGAQSIDILEDEQKNVISMVSDQLLPINLGLDSTCMHDGSNDKQQERSSVDGTNIPEDLASLHHLHAASILRVLQSRFHSQMPYTRALNMCIAVNPYTNLPDLYSEELRQQYSAAAAESANHGYNPNPNPTPSNHNPKNRNFPPNSDNPKDDKRSMLKPHVYEVSAAAFYNLVNTGKSQSILVSGESGAGKTESTKLMLNHLVEAAGAAAAITQNGCDNNNNNNSNNSNSATRNEADPSHVTCHTSHELIQRILDSNPLLEAFGNASTTRNDNSSRFGKLTLLEFDNEKNDGIQNDQQGRFNKCSGIARGARVDTYLLERSRIVAHAEGERTYHVFYQMTTHAALEHFGHEFVGNELQLVGAADSQNDKIASATENFCIVDSAALDAARATTGTTTATTTKTSSVACTDAMSAATTTTTIDTTSTANIAAVSVKMPGPLATETPVTTLTEDMTSPEVKATRAAKAMTVTTEGVCDERDARRTLQALQTLGLSHSTQKDVWRVLAAVHHLLKLSFVSSAFDGSNENVDRQEQDKNRTGSQEPDLKQSNSQQYGDEDGSAVLAESRTSLAVAARLLGCATAKELEVGLTMRTIKVSSNVGHEEFEKVLSVVEAQESRDGIAKALYVALFDWVVARVNEALSETQFASNNNNNNSNTQNKKTIGLLDIFGFESFENRNCFEQFCINYCNQKLQLRFTQEVITSVQLEYASEGIEWLSSDKENLDLGDISGRNGRMGHVNRHGCDRAIGLKAQDVLSVIEAKGGVLAVLNEECMRPGGNPESFVSKLRLVSPNGVSSGGANKKMNNSGGGCKSNNSNNNACLVFDRIDKLAFTVRHYAGPVRYSASLFLAKNTDAVPPSIVDLLSKCKNTLVHSLAHNHMNNNSNGKNNNNINNNNNNNNRLASSSSSLAALTVGSRFKNQLGTLMKTIEQTSQQFVRCIKPNSITSSAYFDCTQVLSQLKCSGVVEALHVARKGYPHKMTQVDFMARFGCLQEERAQCGTYDYTEACRRILAGFLTDFVKDDKDKNSTTFEKENIGSGCVDGSATDTNTRGNKTDAVNSTAETYTTPTSDIVGSATDKKIADGTSIDSVHLDGSADTTAADVDTNATAIADSNSTDTPTDTKSNCDPKAVSEDNSGTTVSTETANINPTKRSARHAEAAAAVGKTKVFLSHSAHSQLEAQLQRKLCASSTTIQRLFRGCLIRKWYTKHVASIRLQLWVRMCIAITRFNVTRNKIILIQSHTRTLSCKRLYKNTKGSIVRIQCMIRCKLAINVWQKAVKDREVARLAEAATRLQTWVRVKMCVRQFERVRVLCVRVQNWWRAVEATVQVHGMLVKARLEASLKGQLAALHETFVLKEEESRQVIVQQSNLIRQLEQELEYEKQRRKMETAQHAEITEKLRADNASLQLKLLGQQDQSTNTRQFGIVPADILTEREVVVGQFETVPTTTSNIENKPRESAELSVMNAGNIRDRGSSLDSCSVRSRNSSKTGDEFFAQFGLDEIAAPASSAGTVGEEEEEQQQQHDGECEPVEQLLSQHVDKENAPNKQNERGMHMLHVTGNETLDLSHISSDNGSNAHVSSLSAKDNSELYTARIRHLEMENGKLREAYRTARNTYAKLKVKLQEKGWVRLGTQQQQQLQSTDKELRTITHTKSDLATDEASASGMDSIGRVKGATKTLTSKSKSNLVGRAGAAGGTGSDSKRPLRSVKLAGAASALAAGGRSDIGNSEEERGRGRGGGVGRKNDTPPPLGPLGGGGGSFFRDIAEDTEQIGETIVYAINSIGATLSSILSLGEHDSNRGKTKQQKPQKRQQQQKQQTSRILPHSSKDTQPHDVSLQDADVIRNNDDVAHEVTFVAFGNAFLNGEDMSNLMPSSTSSSKCSSNTTSSSALSSTPTSTPQKQQPRVLPAYGKVRKLKPSTQGGGGTIGETVLQDSSGTNTPVAQATTAATRTSTISRSRSTTTANDFKLYMFYEKYMGVNVRRLKFRGGI